MRFNKRVANLSEIVYWIALGYIVIWLLLKVIGVINTPVWLEYSPLFAAIFAAGGAMQKMRGMDKTIHAIGSDVKAIKEGFVQLRAEHDMFKSKHKA